MDRRKTSPDGELLTVKDLKKYYPLRTGFFSTAAGCVRAVDGVSFTIRRGETMGLVGESGCGKSSVGRAVLRLCEPTSGSVTFDGTDVLSLGRESLRRMRPRMQMIFQDPYSSLPPRLPVGEIIAEAVREHGIVPPDQLEDHVLSVMRACGLEAYQGQLYPHEFSGGQRQRICIARALALNPEFIVCDEPLSSLDVSAQAQILNLLKRLQKEFRIAYLFISHDLSVVEHISDTVGVMYLGELVEYGPADRVFSAPLHPYTRALLSAVPAREPGQATERVLLSGSPPSPASPPAGCRFHPRCPLSTELCKTAQPHRREPEPGHFCACRLCGGVEG